MATTPAAAAPAADDHAAAGAAKPQAVVHRLRAVPLTPQAFAPFGRVVGAKDDGAVFSAEADAALDLSKGSPRLYVMRLPERGRAFSRITHHARVTQCLGSVQPGVRWYLCVAEATVTAATATAAAAAAATATAATAATGGQGPAPAAAVPGAPFPRPGDITAFRIPHGVLVQLRAGTWHAGPLFDGGLPLGAPPADAAEACAQAREAEEARAAGGAAGGAAARAAPAAAAAGSGLFLDFFNLELTDTNVTDHNTRDYAALGDGEGAQSGVSFEVVDD